MKWLDSRLLTIVLGVAVVFTLSVFLTSFRDNIKLPDNQQGYEPIQPVSYSHCLHAGELGIDCLHCHHGAERSTAAGIPSVNVCMNCHGFVTAPWVNVKAEGDLAGKENRKPQLLVSPELRKLYGSEELRGQMRRKSRGLGRMDASKNVVELAMSLVRREKGNV